MSRTLLAIESATDWLSVALLRGTELMAVEAPEGTRQHASELMPAIDRLLRGTNTELEEIEALGISTGPGSFTSLRIGLATAKGLAFGRSLEAAGVSTLEAMARGTLDRLGGAEGETAAVESGVEVVVLLDARRGEWYAGGWRGKPGEGASMRPSLPEGLYAPDELARDLKGPAVFACPEPDGWQQAFEAAGIEAVEWISGAAARPGAASVGWLAAAQLDRGQGVEPQSLHARYLRRAEAEAKRLGGPVEQGELARTESSGS